MNDTRDILVFVYGTLKRGQRNHGWIADSEYVGEETVRGFEMLDLEYYPAVIEGEGEVSGELYRVMADVFRGLDYLESYPRLYNRMRVLTSRGEAWIYYFESDKGLPRIESGVWR